MDNLNHDLKVKLRELEEWFSQREGSIVAFSGGIDSTLVLFLAGVISGSSDWPYASFVAVTGMVIYFIGGYLKAKYD